MMTPDSQLRDLAAAIAETGSQPDSMPIRQAITVTGPWRVYFHRLNPDGLPWCVSPDAGGWEIAVRHVDILVRCETIHRPKAKPDDEDGRPSAWIAAEGLLTINEHGTATIAAPTEAP